MLQWLNNSRDQFTLANMHLYLSQNTIDPFVFFANHVPLKSELSFSEEATFEKLIEPLNKAISTFGVKIISPLRTLMVRVIENNLGFISLHLYFVKICRLLGMPSEALAVIDYPAFSKSMKRSEQLQFLIQACDVYIQLGKYQQAYHLITKAAKLQGKAEDLLISIYKRLIILSIFTGKSINQFKEAIYKFYSRCQAKISERLGEKLGQSAKKSKLSLAEFGRFQTYLNIRQWRELSQAESDILKNDRLLDVFNASRYGNVGRYIDDEVKGMNWRIKCESVRNVRVGDLDVIKGVNQSSQIYKYDCEQNIMYFNHKACDQQQLNRLITKAFQMQHQTNNCKVEKKEELRREGGIFGAVFSGLGKRRSKGADYDFEDGYD